MLAELVAGEIASENKEKSEAFDTIVNGNGCVVRSFGKAVGVVPKVEDYLKRYDSTIDTLDIAIATIDQAKPESTKIDVGEIVQQEDRRIIVKLIDEFKEESNTDLGNALRNYDHERVTLTRQEIKERLTKGDKVCVFTETPLGVSHMMNVGLSDKGRLINNSDLPGAKATFLPQTNHDTIVFSSKNRK